MGNEERGREGGGEGGREGGREDGPGGEDLEVVAVFVVLVFVVPLCVCGAMCV